MVKTSSNGAAVINVYGIDFLLPKPYYINLSNKGIITAGANPLNIIPVIKATSQGSFRANLAVSPTVSIVNSIGIMKMKITI